MNILELKGISKLYHAGVNPALSNVDLTLAKGKICAVVGASGSGKTTLLRLIAGLEKPTKGDIYIQNELVSSPLKLLAAHKRNVGMVFQNLGLFPHFNIEQNVGFGLKRKQHDYINSLLDIVDLKGYNKRYPHQLSGGEQQRVAIARTLAIKPRLLLLDEPFSSLDASLKKNLRRSVQQIIRTVGISSIFITHDIQDAIDIADILVLLKNGRLIESGSIQELFKHPKTMLMQSIVDELKESAQTTLHFLD